MAKVSIVIPCYFNEGNIPVTTQKLVDIESRYDEDAQFEYILVDDGSKDSTWEKILAFKKAYPHKVVAVKLTRNFGTHNSALAGLHYATGDFVGFLAADLQDPPELIPQMYNHWKNGFKLVLANRVDRDDSFKTKLISNIFHSLIRRIALPWAPTGGFDLWFFDKSIKDQVVELSEKNTHISYLFIWLGYEYVNIPYRRLKREIGESQWKFSKQVKSTIDTILAFSYMPVRLISAFGIVLGFFALLYSGVVLISAMRKDVSVEGWSSLMMVLLTVAAFQMIALGVIGEYLWRILDNSRKRPSFVVDQVIR